MEEILGKVLKLLNDAMGYLKVFIVGATSFFVAKDFALKMVASDDNQKATYDRRIKHTIGASILALVTSVFVGWLLSYFK